MPRNQEPLCDACANCGVVIVSAEENQKLGNEPRGEAFGCRCTKRKKGLPVLPPEAWFRITQTPPPEVVASPAGDGGRNFWEED